jgi:hypothetical protein
MIPVPGDDKLLGKNGFFGSSLNFLLKSYRLALLPILISHPLLEVARSPSPE